MAAILGGLHEDAEILDDFLLTAEVIELKGPQCVLEVFFLYAAFLSYVEVFHVG